jgi:UTP:GlnB (protein PII) uridylyltransferase
LQIIYLSGTNRPGLLTAISAALRDLELEVNKAVVETDAQNGKISDKFFVALRGGGKLEDKEQLATVEKALTTLLDRAAGSQLQPRPKFTTVSIQQDENKRELLYTLMGE